MNLMDLLRRLAEDPHSLRRTLEVVSQLGAVLDASQKSDASEIDDRASGIGLLPVLSELVQPTSANGQSGPKVAGLQTDQVDRVTYNELFHRNAAVAAALGACNCWGERANCPLCNGEGSPGWVSPDENLFAIYVHPVLHQLSGEAVSN